MINRARSTLGPPDPTAVHSERGHEYSDHLFRTPGQIQRLGWADVASSGAQRPGEGGKVLPYRSSHCSRPLHPQLATRPASLHKTDLLAPSSPHCSHSSPHRTHHGAKERSWTRRPGVRWGRPGPPLPTLQPGATRHREGENLPARPEVLLGGTGSPSPLPNAGDPTPRRGEATQDVLYCHFRGC